MHNGIDCLNGLLRGEISAVETYTQAIKRLDAPGLVPGLQECQSAHQERVMKLRDKIASLGGQPSESSGAWGAFAKFMEGAATVAGDKPSISLLEEGEDHGLKAYHDECEKCNDVAIRSYIEGELLPGQEMTHSAMSNLKKMYS